MATSTSHIVEEQVHLKTEKRNITLSLSVETLQKAKVLAAQRGTSVSGLLTQQLEEMVKVDDAYERARTRELARLRSGFTFGNIERMTRDEMHDRKASREAFEEERAR